MDYLRIFHYKNTDSGMKRTDGKIYTKTGENGTGTLTIDIQDFFSKHAYGILNSKSTRSSRFEEPRAIFIDYFEKLFQSFENFDEYSKKIDVKFFNNLTQAQRKDFLLILFDTQIEEKHCFIILTMEARDGLQLEDDNFNVITDLLPDSGAKLKKAAIIFEEETLHFKNNEEPNNPDENQNIIHHAVVIDRQTPDITSTFVKFLDSFIIPEKPGAVGQILLAVFPNALKKYLKDNFTKKDVTDELRNMFSSELSSDFETVTRHLYNKFLSKEKLEEEQLNVEKLSDKIFKRARRKNPAINMSFTAESRRFSKNIFKDNRGGKNINLIISDASLESGDVVIKNINNKSNSYILEVKKKAVSFERKI